MPSPFPNAMDCSTCHESERLDEIGEEKDAMQLAIFEMPVTVDLPELFGIHSHIGRRCRGQFTGVGRQGKQPAANRQGD